MDHLERMYLVLNLVVCMIFVSLTDHPLKMHLDFWTPNSTAPGAESNSREEPEPLGGQGS